MFIFGRHVTAKENNQKIFTFSPHLTSASALPGKHGNAKIASFSLKCCIIALPDFN